MEGRRGAIAFGKRVTKYGDSARVWCVNAEQALYGAFSVNADFDRAPVIFLEGQQSGPRGACHGREVSRRNSVGP